MTIVAGFDFTDGVLVCADTEMTDNVQKFQSSKMKLYSIGGGPNSPKPLRLAFALAGDVPYATRAIALCEQRIADVALVNPQELTNEAIQHLIEDALVEFHEKFIFINPLYRDHAAPQIDLIIGVWPPVTGRASLLCSRECVVNEVSKFDFIGEGQSFARYIAQLFWRERLTEREAYILAAHVLRQTKQNAPNCGKSSEFVFLKHGTGEMQPVWGLQAQHVEIYSDGYMRLLGNPFFELADPGKPFEQVMEQFTPLARGLSGLYKGQRAAYQTIVQGIDEARRERAEAGRSESKPSVSEIPEPRQ